MTSVWVMWNKQRHSVGRHIFSYRYDIWYIWTLDDKYEQSIPVKVQNYCCNSVHIFTMYKSLNICLISFTCTNFPFPLNGAEFYLLLIYQHSAFRTFSSVLSLPISVISYSKRISNNFWVCKLTVLPIYIYMYIYMYYPTMYSGIPNLSVQIANKFTKFHSEMFKGKRQL